MHAQYINELSEKSKKTFVTRVLSSFSIAVTIWLSFAFSMLSDTSWGWSGDVGIITNQIFAYCQMLLILVIIYFASIEIARLHFYNNAGAFFVILISISLYTLLPTFTYIVQKFNYIDMQLYDTFFAFTISLIACTFTVILINILYMWSQGMLELRKTFIHITLIVLVSLFAISWLYFSFMKGWTTILLLYAITAGTDVFAYLGGMLFGKKKMSKYISPNKTIGGGIIGIFGSTMLCLLIMLIFSYVPAQFNILGNFFGIRFGDTDIDAASDFVNSAFWWISIVFIFLVLSIISVVGDLSFSYIKRIYEIKDYSNLIPGHGGVLDRIDSLIFVSCAYLLFMVGVSIFSTTASLF